MTVRDIVCLRTEETKLQMWKVRNCGRSTKGDIASGTCRVQAKDPCLALYQLGLGELLWELSRNLGFCERRGLLQMTIIIFSVKMLGLSVISI